MRSTAARAALVFAVGLSASGSASAGASVATPFGAGTTSSLAGWVVVEQPDEPGRRTRCNGGGQCCRNHPDSDACAEAPDACVVQPELPECQPPV